MAGVLEQIIRSQKRAVVYRNPKELELQTAKEILAEVFGVRLSDVEEMLQNRFNAEDTDKMGSKKMGCTRRNFGWNRVVSCWFISSRRISSICIAPSFFQVPRNLD
jgi:hypothetical protein